LDEVVVVAYGTSSKHELTGSISVSQTLSGRVAGISTQNEIYIRGASINASQSPLYIIDANKKEEAGFDAAFMEAASQANSIRSHFSDYAYWQPRLTTDKQGKASFEVIFPDDVTNWNTYILAMNDKKQSGQTQGNIRSFKPIMAQLSVPRFLVEGDTTHIIGKALNYTADSIQASTKFEVGEQVVYQRQNTFSDGLLDTLQIVAPVDSFSVRYTMQKTDGYFDGEEREIPVFPLGLEETKGEFFILDKDTTFTKTFDASLGTVHVSANANAIDEIDTEIDRVINYRYLCNEQLASKLKALLMKKKIAEYQGIKWDGNKQIMHIIQMLMERRNKDGWWGWWQNSEVNYSFSFHVLNALEQAKQQGFTVNIDLSKIGELAVLYLDNMTNSSSKIELLRILKNVNAPIDYAAYLDAISKDSIHFNDYLKLTELRQLNKLPVNTDTLKHFRHETIFGNVYYSSEKEKTFNLENSKIQNTLLAYRILKRENKANTKEELRKIRFYFLESKSANGWLNTYESMAIMETILPDILEEKQTLRHTVLKLSGDVNQTIYTQRDDDKKQTFPYETSLNASKGITVTKTGDEPVYFTIYQREWNKNPEEKQSDFVITTHFDSNKNQLEAGKPVKLIANLEVKKDAEYVMINIPIPAGCSYGEKPQQGAYNTHREYFKNETAIFCQKLSKGKYTYEIELIPRFTGIYNLNPAQVELMYFPTFNANNEIRKIEITGVNELVKKEGLTQK
jgi:uncharacterized protein YfaS (alpha-2-macroglobulin family)